MARTLNQDRHSLITPPMKTHHHITQEMVTFVAHHRQQSGLYEEEERQQHLNHPGQQHNNHVSNNLQNHHHHNHNNQHQHHHHHSHNNHHLQQYSRSQSRNNDYVGQSPIPLIPSIDATKKRGRLPPLTIEEYEEKYRQSATDLELIERVFAGSIACNHLRAALWPYLFGLILHRGRFERTFEPTSGSEAYIFIEHEANKSRWRELTTSYEKFRSQWRSITPDQEMRFTMFRERRALIERDVIRCDRLHSFYADEPQNLEKLTQLLMTYMMYDFDIGYVQGMSDIAGPILYMYNGNLIKSFWIFVEVMKLFRRNFESTQKSIHFQLRSLYELIKTTDRVFAQYLEDNESSNCFFAFRAIVCQFKRELMKEDGDDYSKVLFLWDSIWCVERRCALQKEMRELTAGLNNIEHIANNNKSLQLERSKPIAIKQPHSRRNAASYNAKSPSYTTRSASYNHPKCASYNFSKSPSNLNHHQNNAITQSKSPSTRANNLTHNTSNNQNSNSNNNNNNNNNNLLYTISVDPNQADSLRYKLTETEVFVLALCLSMIRRKRDTILANRLDGTDIHLHFIDPKLANNLDDFIEQAMNIYSFLKNDFDLNRLTSPQKKQQPSSSSSSSASNTTGTDTLPTDSIMIMDNDAASSANTDYDFLNDFLIINGASGS